MKNLERKKILKENNKNICSTITLDYYCKNNKIKN